MALQFVAIGLTARPLYAKEVDIKNEIKKVFAESKEKFLTLKHLYKYSKFDEKNHFKSLFNGDLFYSSPKYFNDPYDCLISFDNSRINQKQFTSFMLKMKESWGFRKQDIPHFADLKKVEKELVNFENIVNDIIKEKLGVTCTTTKNDNLPMWNHYADEHKGFCVEFNLQYLTKRIDEINKFYESKGMSSNLSVVDIQYSEKFPQIAISETADFFWFTLMKSEDWKYEDEWRLFYTNGANSIINFGPELIKSVYFGKEADQNNIDNVLVDLKSKGIKTYKMELSRLTYKLNPIEI